MIQKNVVYHKSAKGAEAIATRQHGLSPKLRSMLILIDGKRTDGRLLKRIRPNGRQSSSIRLVKCRRPR